MTTIDLTKYRTVQIIFDDFLTMEISGNYFDVFRKIEWAFQNYPFKNATVTDVKSRELLITVKNG